LIAISETIALAPEELEFHFILGSGPGGQNVNKVNSAAQLRFDVRRSPSLDVAVKARLERLAGARLTREGVVVITARRYRSQERNRADALARLAALIEKASVPPPIRRPSAPSRAEKEQRLRAKSRRARIKHLRGRPEESE
jgi:ribosome-associated protein